jgi:hypothetical protein
MSKKGNANLKWLVGAVSLFTLTGLGAHAQPWESVPAAAQRQASSLGITWEPVQPQQQPQDRETATAAVAALQWSIVSPEDLKAYQQSLAEQAAQQAASPKQIVPKPFVTGGLYQIRRGNEILPAISQVVPSGYGAKFGTAQMGLWLESCNTVGGYVCGTNSFQTEFNSNGKGIWSFYVGLGDPTKIIGIDLGLQITSLATTRPDQTNEGTSFGSGQGIDLAISRSLSEDFSVKIGAFNLIELDEVQLDQGRSAYGVFSGRFDLGGPPEENSNDLYFTVGVANGRYRPLNVIVDDQTQECAKDVAENGSRTKFKFGDLCNVWGLDYGNPYPVASLAYLVSPQMSLIAEWWGRNLSLAASFKPIKNINWVITPGVTSLIKNADWDPTYPGYTETVRFQLTTSIGF